MTAKTPKRLAKAKTPAAKEEEFDKLSDEQKAELVRMSKRVRDKYPVVKFSAKPRDGGGVEYRSNLPMDTYDGLAMCDILGTQSERLAERFVQQIQETSSEIKNDRNMAAGLAAGLGFMQGIAPQNEVEATLAMQMYAVHNMMMSVARRAEKAEFPDAIQFWFNQTGKLARTYTAQVEALAKLRNGGKQTVNVTHTHIDARGSQNVIADTVTTRGGGADENVGQSVAQALAYQPGAPCAPVRSEVEADGLPVQGAGDQGQA